MSDTPVTQPGPGCATDPAQSLHIEYGVITAVPDHATDDGNLCSAIGEVFVKVGEEPRDGYGTRDVVKPLVEVAGPRTLLYFTEVFQVGEILVLNETGREYAYPGRKPSKWNVTCEHFDTIEAAVRRAREVIGVDRP